MADVKCCHCGDPTQPTKDVTAWAEHVARTDGTVYRARRCPLVREYGGYGHGTSDPTGMLVVRTHDVDVACALVTRRWAAEFGGPLPVPVPVWVRFVPWSDDAGYDESWQHSAPAQRGAVPAVDFREASR